MSLGAAHRVQAIPELLEMVLLKLPSQRVLQFQRVCRAWKNIINVSILLRQMLWYLPSTPKEHGNNQNQQPRIVFNPLMTYLGFHTGTILSLEAKYWLKYLEDSRPKLYKKQGEPTPEVSYETLWMANYEHIRIKPESWMTMLAVQPPTRQIAARMVTHQKLDLSYFIETVHAEGLRLGEVADALTGCKEYDLDYDYVYNSCASLEPLVDADGERLARSEHYKEVLAGMDPEADVKVVTVDNYFQGRHRFTVNPVVFLKREMQLTEDDLCTPAGASRFRLTRDTSR